MSRFGLSSDQFFQLTPVEFYYALKDDDDVRLLNAKPICEAIRMETFWLFNIQAKRKIQNPKRFMKFDWDKQKDKKPQTLEQMKAVMKSVAGATKQKDKN